MLLDTNADLMAGRQQQQQIHSRLVGMAAADPTPMTPIKVTPIPRSTSDASMGCDDDDMMESPPTRGMPDIKALAAALEPLPDMTGLKVCPLLSHPVTNLLNQLSLRNPAALK